MRVCVCVCVCVCAAPVQPSKPAAQSAAQTICGPVKSYSDHAYRPPRLLQLPAAAASRDPAIPHLRDYTSWLIPFSELKSALVEPLGAGAFGTVQQGK